MRRIEVCVAIFCLVGVLVIFLPPTVQRVREDAARKQCLSNLHAAYMETQWYADQHGFLLPGTVPNEGLPPAKRLSWGAGGMGFLWAGEKGSVILPAWQEPWDSPHNLYYGGCRVYCLMCPSRPVPDAMGPGGVPLTQYVGVAGVGPDAASLPAGHRRAGLFGYDRRIRPGDIVDGASQTLFALETALDNGPWTAGGRPTVRELDPAGRPYLGQGRPFGGLHAGGCTAVFADGSARFITDSVSPQTLEALATIAGKEEVRLADVE